MPDPAPAELVSGASSAGTRPRGRPRSEKSRTAILTAAEELFLTDGLDAVSMDAIAERAAVSKATIYRWWPTKETLAIDALYADWAGVRTVIPDTGELRGDLIAILVPWVERLRERPYARIVGAILTRARSDEEFAKEYDRRMVQPRRAQTRSVVARAFQRGDLRADTDIEVALDLLYGPLYHRLLQGHLPLDEQFVLVVVDTVLRGLLMPE